MHILHIGDIMGSPGRLAFARVVSRMRQRGEVDFVVVNGENSAGGKGITSGICEELFAAGADVITLGDHAWDQKEIITFIDREPRLLRPANFAPGCPGRGVCTVDTPLGRIAVIMLIGRVFLPPVDCPFRCVDQILGKGATELGPTILVEMHAEATSEKNMMGRYLDGRVTSVVGTHTHVQTSDEVILPKGTAYLTDLGMTGPKDSIIGIAVDSVKPRFLSGMPSKFEVATDRVSIEGVLLAVNEKTGKASKIKRIREFID